MSYEIHVHPDESQLVRWFAELSAITHEAKYVESRLVPRGQIIFMDTDYSKLIPATDWQWPA